MLLTLALLLRSRSTTARAERGTHHQLARWQNLVPRSRAAEPGRRDAPAPCRSPGADVPCIDAARATTRRRSSGADVRISLRISDEIYAQVRKLAERERRPIAM